MSQGDVVKHGGVEGTKLACRKAIWLGTRRWGCRWRHKACMSQGDVARYEDAEGDTKLAYRKENCKSWVFGEACGPFTRPLPFGKEVRLFWNFVCPCFCK
ncbi:unnamed protein product [Prunus armeniaca]